MHTITPEIENVRAAIPFFAVSTRHQSRHKAKIEQLAQTHLSPYCTNIGLNLKNIECELIDHISDSSNSIKVNITSSLTDSAKSTEQKIFDALKLKDELNLGRRDYIKLRNMLGKDKLPSHYSVLIMEKQLDMFFTVRNNSHGYYIGDPLSKIKFVCEKFLKEHNQVENNTFLIKLAGDGTRITKNLVDLLNYTFTVINDENLAKTSKGNYDLGEY
jgi:hypothetical protein